MLGVSDVQEVTEVGLYSGYLADERPLSIIIIAAVGAGKTEIIAHYPESTVSNIIYTNDITAFALHKRHGKELKDGKIKHILIPDLLAPLNKQKEQADHFITFMNGIIEEGLAKVESRDSRFSAQVPVRCGLITSIAKKDLDSRKDRWAAIGFLSRMLPISYAYGQETIEQIFDYIITEQYHGDKPIKLNLPKETSVILPLKLARQIQPWAIRLRDPEDEYGFRRLKQLQVFVKAHALYRGRVEVNEEDLAELERLSPFMNRDCSKVI